MLEKRFAQAQTQHKKEIAKLLSAHEDALAEHAREWKMESDAKIKQMKEQLHKHYGNTISELKGQVEDLASNNESQRTELQETNVELDRKVQSTQMLLQRIDNLAKDKRDAHKKYAGASRSFVFVVLPRHCTSFVAYSFSLSLSYFPVM